MRIHSVFTGKATHICVKKGVLLFALLGRLSLYAADPPSLPSTNTFQGKSFQCQRDVLPHIPASATNPTIELVLTVKGDRIPLHSEFLNFLREREYDMATLTVIGSGSTSFVLQIKDRIGRPRVFMVPSQNDTTGALAGYRKFISVLHQIAVHNEADQKYFTFVDASHLEGAVPWLEVEGAISSLASNHFFSDRSAYSQALILSDMAESLDALHRNGFLHGDIKPSNFLVTDQRFGHHSIILSDLESATTLGEQSPTWHTPAFIPLENSIHARSAITTFSDARPERDTYALMLSYYELLLGSPIKTIWPDRRSSQLTSPPYVSVHTLNPKIPAPLSMLAWTHFKTAEDAFKAAQAAARDLERVENKEIPQSLFLSEYLGPKILEHLPAEEAALMIGSARELLEPFMEDVNGGLSTKTGLTSQARERILTELARARGKYRIPASLEELRSFQRQ